MKRRELLGGWITEGAFGSAIYCDKCSRLLPLLLLLALPYAQACAPDILFTPTVLHKLSHLIPVCDPATLKANQAGQKYWSDRSTAWIQSYILPPFKGSRASARPSKPDSLQNFASARIYTAFLVGLTRKGGFHLISTKKFSATNYTQTFARADGKRLQIGLHWTGRYTEVKMLGE